MSTISRRQAIKLAAAGTAALASTALTGCNISIFSDDDTAPSNGTVRTLDDIISSDVFVVGIVSDLRPYSYVDDLGNYQGFDIEIARRIAQDLGVGIKFVNVETANRIIYLQNNKVDMVLSCFTVTDARKEKVDFAEAYMQVATGILSHTENPITDLNALGNRPIITTAGSATELILAETCPDAVLEKYDSYSSARMAFENNPDAGWAADVTDLVSFSIQQQDKYVLGIDSVSYPRPMAPAITKGNQTLLDWLNEELVSLGSENFFHKNYDETLLDTYGPEYADIFIVEPGQD